MYERLLDKDQSPTKDELIIYCGENANNFRVFNDWLAEKYNTVQTLRFPYGKKYGWCITHRKGKNLICDVFAEAGAFTVMIRLSDQKFDALYSKVGGYTQKYIDNRYPCGNGGWIHYRVSCFDHIEDLQNMMDAKCT